MKKKCVRPLGPCSSGKGLSPHPGSMGCHHFQNAKKEDIYTRLWAHTARRSSKVHACLFLQRNSVQAGRWVSILILDVPKENISYLQDQLALLPDCSCPSLGTCGPWRMFLLRSVLQQTVVKEGAVLVPIPRRSCADSFISLLLLLFSR